MSFRKILSPLPFLAACAAMAALPDDARAGFELTAYRGTGCPQGSARAVVAPDGQSMTVLFDRLVAAAPQTDGDNDNDQAGDELDAPKGKHDSRVSQKICNLIVTADVPEGTRIDALDVGIDYRGFTQVDRGARAAFKALLVEKRGMGKQDKNKDVLDQRRWRADEAPRAGGPVAEDWTLSARKTVDVRSKCAKRGDRQIRFALRNIVLVELKRDGASGQISLDSSDLAGQLRFAARTSRCGG